ncbi:MAG TPA: thermonuclease family protein [Mesorhizobium sp.]|jgi:endonuclease YncB( thermonuclease family)|nr:thermonuclease family protein [Mesorhizobium sp.]
MRGVTTGVLALCGAGFLAAGVHQAGQRVAPSPAGLIHWASSPPSQSTSELTLEELPADRLEPQERPAKPVGLGMVVPAVPEGVALERVAPRGPLSPSEEEDGAPKPTLLHRPLAIAAGRIEAGGHRIDIAGLSVTEPERTCERAGERTWPCGAVARTAFRNWLRGRAVECLVPEKPLEEGVAAACSLGKADVGLWLVEQGFSEAAESGPYGESMRAAQAARRGIWGGGPAGN